MSIRSEAGAKDYSGRVF